MNDPQIYNIAGGVAKESATSIGASVALNDVTAVTRAFIGNATQLTGTPTLTFVDSTLTGAPSLRFEAVELSGTPALNFTDNASEDDVRDTITRSTGSWLTDGFGPGQMITIEGSDENDGTYLIEEVTSTTITLAQTEALAEGTIQTAMRHELTGAPTLTFTDNEAAVDKRDTIARNAGSWLADGFAAGQTIRIEGAGANDGRYVIDSVTASTITLILGSRVSNGTASGAKVDTLSLTAADTITRSSGSWLTDGFVLGQTITVAGTGTNDGTYTILAVTDDQITVNPNEVLIDQTVASAATIKAPDSIRRDGGSWAADGFVPGQCITITNAGANNGTYEITEVSNAVLTLVPAATLTDAVSTTAVITDDPLAATGVITVDNVLEIKTDANPLVYSFSLAGATATTKNEAGSATPAEGATNPLAGTNTSAATSAAQGATNPGSTNPAKQSGTGVAIAAAASVNFVNSVSQTSLIAPVVITDVLTVKAENDARIGAASGGLSFSKASADLKSPPTNGQKAVALAGAFSWNEIENTTESTIDGSGITLRGAALDETTGEDPERRLTVLADSDGEIYTLAAGLGGAVSQGTANSGNTLAGSLAGSVSINSIEGDTEASIINSDLLFEAGTANSDAKVRAFDEADIYAIAGGLSLAIAKGGSSGSSTAVSVGAAIAVNKIELDTDASIENSDLDWADGAPGKLDVEAESSGSMKVFTVAGGVAGAMGSQGSSGAAGGGAGSGSVNQVDVDTTAVIRGSTVDVSGTARVDALNEAEIIAGAGALTVSFASAGSSSASSVSVVGSFAINNIGTESDASVTWAEFDDSTITAGGNIEIDADMDASILAVGIGASGSLSTSTGGSALGVGLAGSIGVNAIYNSTRALVHNSSSLKTDAGSAAAINVTAGDESRIESVAGAANVTITLGQGGSSTAVGLGVSLTINDIENATRAAIEDSAVNADGSITVAATSNPEIKSLGFGVAVSAALSSSSTSVAAAATGALSFNTIESTVEATIHDTAAAGSSSVLTGSTLSVTATDTALIEATAAAAAASVSGSTSAKSISVTIGLALAHNTIDKDVSASIVGVSSVLTGANDVIVNTIDSGTIEVTSIAASLAVAVGKNTAVGVAGGASESTNIIQSNVDAFVENSNLGTSANKVGKVDIDAASTAHIVATVGTVAVGVGIGQNGVGVAIGVGVARNFIGWNIDESETANYQTGTGLPQGSTLATNQTVKITEGARTGDIYKYLGDNLTQPTETGNSSQTKSLTKNSDFVRLHDDYDGPGGTTGAIYKYIGENEIDADLSAEDYLDIERWELASIDLRTEDFSDRRVWEHVNVEATSSRVSAYLDDTSVHASGALTADAITDQNIEAVVFAATVAIAGGCRAGIAVSAGGVYTENRIATDVKAYIDGDGATGIHAATIALHADDTSVIEADAVAASIAAGFGGKVGVGFSIGIALAVNEIDNHVAAYITNANTQVQTTSGGITVTATEDATIDAVSAAASLAVGLGVKAGVAISGAGAESTNVILSKANAYIKNSSVTSKGDVSLTATFGGTIDAHVAAVTGAVGVGGNAGVGASIGAAVARNLIGWNLGAINTLVGSMNAVEAQAYLEGSSVNAGGNLTLTATSTPNITAGVGAGSVAIAVGQVGVGLSGSGVLTENKIATKIRATITGDGSSGIKAAGIALSATDDSDIDADAGAASIAAAFGQVGVAVTIGLALSRNDIANDVQSFIINADNGVFARGGHLMVNAEEKATIDTVAVAASVGVGVGSDVGVALSGAGAEGTNLINNVVKAFIENSIAKAGVFTYSSVQQPNELRTGDTVRLSNGNAYRYIDADRLDPGGFLDPIILSAENYSNTAQWESIGSRFDLTVDAKSTSKITAVVGGVAAAVGVGFYGGVAGSVGVSLARNLIGYDGITDDSGLGNKVIAYIKNSTINAAGDVAVRANAKDTMETISFAGSVAVAVSIFAGAFAGSGTEATTLSSNEVHATIENSSVDAARDLIVTAIADSQITKVQSIGVAVSAAIGLSVSLTVNASLADSSITNDVLAKISSTTATTIIVGRNLTVLADQLNAKITGVEAVSTSVSIGLFSASGGGICIYNTVDNKVEAAISGPIMVDVTGNVTVSGKENAHLEGDAVAVTVAISLGAAIGAALVKNEILSEISSSIVGATVGSTNTSVLANSTAAIPKTFTAGVAAALVGATGNRADADIKVSTKAFTQNATLLSSNTVEIRSTATNTAKAGAYGGAFGAIAIGAMIADVSLGLGQDSLGNDIDEVIAEAGTNTKVVAGTLLISASITDDLLAESVAAGAGLVAATGSPSNTFSDNAAIARLGANTEIATNSFQLKSVGSQKTDASADSYSLALGVGSGAGAINKNYSKANVDIGTNAKVTSKFILVSAKNELTKDRYKDASNLRAGSASVAGLTVLTSDTEIGSSSRSFQANVNIASGAHLTATGDNNSPGVFRIETSTDVTAVDSVRIETVSGFSLSVGLSEVTANTDANINVTGAKLENQSGDLFLTSRTGSGLRPSANVLMASAYTGAVGADATAIATSDATITVLNSDLRGSDVLLYAGRDSTGVPNLHDSFANVEITTFSLLPNIVVPVVKAEINENNVINLTGTTQIRALEDVNLLANEGVGGDKRAGTDGIALALSLLPYGFPVPDGDKVTSVNLVNIGTSVKLEAGLNARSIVLLKPVTDLEGPDLDPALLGTELTSAKKTALLTSDGVTIPNDIRYEYGRLNLENIAFTVSAGTIFKVVNDGDGNRVGGGGDVGSFYQYRTSAAGGDLIILENENFADTNRWTKLTTTSIEGNRDTGTPGQPSIAEAQAALDGSSSSDITVYTSDVTQEFAETLRDQFYVIKPVTLAAPTVTYQNLGGLLVAQRQKILDWIASHATNVEAIARYEVQLGVVEETLADFGLLESIEVEGQTITVVKKELDTLFVNLPSVYSAPGSIFVEGSLLSHVGVSVALANQQLVTRAGAEIVIRNQTPYSMVLNDVIVRDNKRVDVVNGQLKVLAPGNVYFNGASLTAVNDTTEPSITVTQQALSPLSRYAIPVPDVDLDLGLYLVGDLVNEAGSATVRNFDGSITVSGEIRAKTVDVQAATDFTLNTEDWLHTNKDPRQYLNYDALRIAAFNAGSGNVFQAGSTNSVYTSALASLNTAINKDSSKILAQGRIAITARYLNIDGLIQSGVQTVTVNVASNFRSSDTKSFLDDTGKPISGISFGTDGVPVEGYFDAEKQAIVIDDVVPSGGRIIIAGQIISTGNGRLKVAYGYANVDIRNDSPYQTIVNRIDTTKYRDGKITLVDTARASGPLKKEYVVAPDGTVTETTFNGTLQTENVEIKGSDAVVSSINYVLQSTVTHAPNSAITFSPETDLRYIWTEGQEKTQTTVTKYEKNSFNLLGDNGLADALSKDNSWTSRDVFYTDKKPLLESESATKSLPGSQAYMLGDAYTIEYVQKRNEAVTVTPGITVVRYTHPFGVALEQLLLLTGTDTTNGVYGHYYRYAGTSETKLILPDQNYKDTALWEDLGASGTQDFLSTFRNYTLTTEKWTTGGGWLRKKTVHTLTTEIIGLKDFYTHCLDADQPISINFVGGASNPQININSVGNLLIQGNIDNTSTGTTNLTSTNGDVIVAGSSAIFGASPNVTAGDDVRIAVEGDMGPLDVTAGGDIDVDVIGETGPASLTVGHVTTSGGDVFINAPDGVENEDANSCIEGDFVQILTINGGVGTSGQALSINSDVNETGGLAIRAEGNIFVTEKDGDLRLAQPTEWATPLASIESTTGGTITLRTTDGSIVDAWFDQFRAPSQAESDARDAQLALTGTAAREAAESAIRSDENARTQLYHSYWQTERNLTRGSVSSTLAIDSIDAATNTITFASPHGLTNGAQVFFSVGVDLTDEDFTETMRWTELAPNYDLDTPPVGPVMLVTNDYVKTVDGVLHRYVAVADTVDLDATDFFDTTLWATVLPNHIVPSTARGRVDLRTNQLVQDTDGNIYQYLGLASGQTNLTNGAEYFAIVVNSTTIKLATTRYDAAIAASPVALDIQLTGDAANFNLLRYNYTASAYNAGQSVATQFTALHASLSGASYNTDYVFQFTAGEKQARIDARTFSSGSLQFPVPASVFNALYPEMAFPAGFVVTPTSSETPNIIGSSVTLVTGGTAKNVGNLTAPTTLDLTSGFDGLTAADQQLLSQITVNDLFGVSHPVYRFVGTSGSVALGSQNFSNTALWQKITPNFTSSGQTSAVSLATGNIVLAQTSKTAYGLYRFLGGAGSFKLSDENYANTQRWQKITSNFNSGDGTVALNNGQLVTDRTKVESITFQLIDDVNVEATANVSVDAGNNVALSAGGTLKLDHVKTSGNVRLQAVSSIVDQLIGGTTAAISTFGGVNLISGGFVAANATDPLRLQLAPTSPFSADVTGLLNVVQVSNDVTINRVFQSISDLFVSQVNAGGDVKIVVQQGDLVIGTIATATNAILDAQRSILDAFNDAASPVFNINAVDVTLTAGTNIGALGNFLDVQGSGKLNATAGTSIFIHGIGSLNLDRVKATTGDVYLSTTGSLLASQQDTLANVVGRYINLSAPNGTIGTVSEPLDLDSSFSANSKVDATASGVVVLTERIGNLLVGAITSTTSNVHLVSAGSILDADNDSASDVNGNDIHLTAQNGSIGVSTNDLEINTHFSGGSLLDAHATGDIFVTEVTEFLHVDNAVSDAGNIRLTVNETSAGGEDLIVGLGDLIEALLGSILLLVGDDVLIDVGGSVSSKTALEVYGDHGNADPGTGTNIDIDGSLSSASIVLAGARDGDRIDLSPQALVGHTRVIGDNDGLSGGEDTIILDQLPSVSTSHDRPNHDPISGSPIVRDTIDVDGRGGTDTYLVNVSGSGVDYLVNMRDTGAPDDGADTLTINGTSSADVFLMREHFVALLLMVGVDDNARPVFSNAVERINYNSTINGRLLVSSGDGDDQFYVDDNSSMTTLDGGKGKDLFQIGQVFGSNPNGYDYPPGDRPDDLRVVANDTQNIDLTADNDEISLLRITRGWLSPGISNALTAFGGEGADTFNVYSNKAVLRMEGESGNDIFVIRAFPAQDDIIAEGGDDDDHFEYNINAPVSINGGLGFDTVVVLGTEQSDAFIITEDGVFGAGLNVRVDGVEESLEVDGLEGDDYFYILSTRGNVVTTVIGGLGSDSFNVAGDVTQPIFSQDPDGRIGVINQGTVSVPGNPYDKLVVDGVAVSIANEAQGKVVITESGGSTELIEDQIAIDSYQISLFDPLNLNGATVAYLNVSAGLASTYDRRLAKRNTGDANGPHEADSVLVSIDGGLTWVRAGVLKFTAANWAVPQTVLVKAAHDETLEGERKVMVSHSLMVFSPSAADVAAFGGLAIPNVEVRLLDDDLGSLLIRETANSTRVLEGDAASEISDTYEVRLAVDPTQSVTVNLGFSVASQIKVYDEFDNEITSLTFSPGNNNWRTLKIRAVNDAERENTSVLTISHTFSTLDPVYSAAESVDLNVRIFDNDSPNVLVTESNGSTRVVKGVSGDDYTLRLVSQPTADVYVNLYGDGQTVFTGASTVGQVDNRLLLRTVGDAWTANVDFATNGADPDTITRAGISWAVDGVSIGSLLRINGSGPLYKVNAINDVRSGGVVVSSSLILTLDGNISGLTDGNVSLQRMAWAVKFSAADWAKEVRISVAADDNFVLDPDQQFVRSEPFRNHLVNRIQGPLIIEGGVAEDKDRSIRPAVMLPTEQTAMPIDVDVDTDETQQADRLNVFNDSSTSDDQGWMTAVELRNDVIKLGDTDLSNNVRPINLSGLGMRPGSDGRSTSLIVDISEAQDGSGNITFPGGITFDDIEITEILLGQGNDQFHISATSTGTPGAAANIVTVLHGGGNTALGSGLMGGDTVIVTGGGGPNSPLVIYGDTSQNGHRYDARPDLGIFTGNGVFYQNPGDDMIDASASQGAVTIYGGRGNDLIRGSQADDQLAGGSGDDTIFGEGGHDHIYGDSGFNLAFDVTKDVDDAAIVPRLLTVPTVDTATSLLRDGLLAGRDLISGNAGNDMIFGDHGVIEQSAGTLRLINAANVTLMRIDQPVNGAADVIEGNEGNDLIIAGADDDTVSSGTGNDLIFGDHGRVTGNIDLTLLPLNSFTPAFTFTSIATQNSDLGGDDLVNGGSGDDIVIGGQGFDRILGGTGDDDIMGGHTVADGHDSGDWIDGGAGNDFIAGDNASIRRDPRTTDTRFRTLVGTTILSADGNGNVTATAQVDPSGTAKRTVTLFNHASTTVAEVYGSDAIAGGSGNDTIFGQLGNDAIQGDGAVVNAAGTMIYNVALTKLSADDIDGVGTDGDDYIEGGGGNDTILGNLGQDDIIGGSSNLFGTPTAAHRPDGSDLIYRGSGTRAGRNDLGDESLNGHARDADVILGDNGNIFRLVGINGIASGNYLTFNYDTYGPMRIVPRSTQYLDYAFGDANNNAFSDEIHGESGDDVIHGMSGNDVIFGDGQDDDLIGGAGNDRIFGGAGEDGILGDDGRNFTSRNGLTETLHGIVTPTVQGNINLTNTLIGAITNVNGRLKKSVDLAAYRLGGHDVMYGGLGDDFIHGGFGDDAMSGAEATTAWFLTTPLSDASVLNYDATTRMFAAYNPMDPLSKISGFILNFEATAAGNKINDGMDSLFGDEGNDWLVGGTLNDRMFGGMGDDLLNGDDNLDTNGGLNNAPDAPLYADADFAFGGGGFDVMIANTGAERLIDWVKHFNTYVVPVIPTVAHPAVASPTVLREASPILSQFLRDLAFSSGFDADTDPLSNEFHAELGIITNEDGQTWFDQIWQKPDRDPVPTNLYTGIDTLGGFETLPVAGIRIVQTAGITVNEYKASNTILVALTSPPLQNVVLTIASQNTAEVIVNTSTLTFTPLNWNIPQAVTVTGVDDTSVDGHKQVNVTISVNTALSASSYAGVAPQIVVVTNQDNDLSKPTINGPTALTAVQRPTITWTVDPAAAGYDVWISNVSTLQNPFLITTSSTNSLTPTADLGIGVFDLWVRSFRTDGIKGPWSAMYRIQINTPVSITPTAAVQPTSRPTITWAPLVGAVRYDVWINNLTTGQSEFVRDLNVTTTSWTPPADLPLSAYRMWVRGIDASGRFALWSVAANFRIATAPTPIGPVASTFDRTPTFTWTPVTGAVTYNFQLRNLATGVTVHNIQNLPTPTWTAPTDLPVGNYRWWSIAIGANSLAGNWSAPTDFSIGGFAKFTAPSGTYSTTPTFNWLAVGGAARYELQINRVDVVQYKVVNELNLTGTSFTVTTPLVAGGHYRIWIRAISTTGEVGPWSTTLDFSVAATDSVRSEDASLNDISKLDVLDGLLVTLLHNHAQPRIVTATQDMSRTSVASQEPVSRDTDINFKTDVYGNTDSNLIEIDKLIDSIVTDLLINNPDGSSHSRANHPLKGSTGRIY